MLVADLKNIELEVIGFVGTPQNGMIRRLGAELHLTQAAVRGTRGLPNGLGEELGVHVVRAGAGGKVAAVLDELHAAQVNLAVALDGVFNGVFGFCERRGIENDDVELLAFVFERGEQIKNVGALELDRIGKMI